MLRCECASEMKEGREGKDSASALWNRREEVILSALGYSLKIVASRANCALMVRVEERGERRAARE